MQNAGGTVVAVTTVSFRVSACHDLGRAYFKIQGPEYGVRCAFSGDTLENGHNDSCSGMW